MKTVTVVFAKWSLYDQVCKKRLDEFRANGLLDDWNIIEVMEPEELAKVDADNVGSVTPVAIVSDSGSRITYRGKDIETIFPK